MNFAKVNSLTTYEITYTNGAIEEVVADHYVQYREDGYVNFYIWSDEQKREKRMVAFAPLHSVRLVRDKSATPTRSRLTFSKTVCSG